MAFNNSKSKLTSSTQDDSWKATGFLNVHLVNPDGTLGRIIGNAGIKLFEAKAKDAAVINRLDSGGQEALDALKEKIAFSWVRADKAQEEAEAGF